MPQKNLRCRHVQQHCPTGNGEIGQSPLIAAVHPAGHTVTSRASRLGRPRANLDPQRRARLEHAVDAQPDEVREQDARIKITPRP
ncbi:hypothetical protein [Pseudonocardia sp. H11422]|uniref:hypothetical protein n=1 Tax=Pseudonocardia sp. H11422 TaxID=2835866 RepID=UPI0027E37DF5|nr:hypothetical protein [Pseudonocardia sp. H11422]